MGCAHRWLIAPQRSKSNKYKIISLLCLAFNIYFQDLLDPEKGYVKDDSITLEVYVKADAPHGVRYVILFNKIDKRLSGLLKFE